jgi:protein FRA10AC1
MPGLATLELPFAYAEHGQTKTALVKVVLCAKCVKKINWKREHDKAAAAAAATPTSEPAAAAAVRARAQAQAQAAGSTPDARAGLRDRKVDDAGRHSRPEPDEDVHARGGRRRSRSPGRRHGVPTEERRRRRSPQ